MTFNKDYGCEFQDKYAWDQSVVDQITIDIGNERAEIFKDLKNMIEGSEKVLESQVHFVSLKLIKVVFLKQSI